MIRNYTFEGEKTGIQFDDSKTVRELILCAFEQYGYDEPAGMDIVTLFQSHHSDSYNGWFTRDTSRICAEEIENPDGLCFAYQMPGVFYFAEGGWGHHMEELGNHPLIPDPVSIRLRFDDFDNTVVINGKYTFGDIAGYLKKTRYIPQNSRVLLIHPVGIKEGPLSISLDDKIMRLPLNEFLEKVREETDRTYTDHGHIYHEIFEI